MSDDETSHHQDISTPTKNAEVTVVETRSNLMAKFILVEEKIKQLYQITDFITLRNARAMVVAELSALHNILDESLVPNELRDEFAQNLIKLQGQMLAYNEMVNKKYAAQYQNNQAPN